MEDIIDKLLKGGPDYDEAIRQIQSSPELAAWLLKQQQEAEAGKTTAKVGAALELLKNAGFTAASLGQIAKANQGVRQLTPPAIPAVPGLSPEVSNALYEAQRGVNTDAALSPVRQGIQDAYTESLNQAANISGGQAGAYQSLAGLANVQRMKAQLGLAPVAAELTMQNQSNINDLLGLRLQERQNQFENQYYNTNMAMGQYDKDAAAVGALGAQGRTNLYDALGRLGDATAQYSPYLQTPQPATQNDSEAAYYESRGFPSNWDQTPSFFDSKEVDDYMKRVREQNILNLSDNPYYNPYTRIG